MNDNNFKNDIDAIHESTENWVKHKQESYIGKREIVVPKKKNSDSDDSDQLEYVFKKAEEEVRKAKDRNQPSQRGYEPDLQIDSVSDKVDFQFGED